MLPPLQENTILEQDRDVYKFTYICILYIGALTCIHATLYLPVCTHMHTYVHTDIHSYIAT